MVGEMRALLGGLPTPEQADAIWKDIWYHEAHSSTALEGNTLVRREVEALLKEGNGGWVSGGLVTLTEVRHVHRLVMTPVWEIAPHPHADDNEGPGNWRRHDINPFGGGMKPPDHTQIPALIRDWVDGLSSASRARAPIGEFLARHHAAFER